MAITRASQSTATVIPLMMGVGLFGCFSVTMAAVKSAAGSAAKEINQFDSIIILIPVGVIGAVGSAAVVFMASQNRSKDLTSLRIAGASPLSSLAVFLSEAIIYVTTALLVAVIGTLATCGLLVLSLFRWNLHFDLSQVELIGSTSVAAVGAITTIGIVTICGVLAWRRPLATALADR